MAYAMAAEVIGRVHVNDGWMGEVFEDVEGQYVNGDDGKKVRGLWILPKVDDGADKPLIVSDGGLDF